MLEDFYFPRLDPTVIRLIIGVGARHQLQVRAFLIAQDLRPHLPFGAVTPLEELLTRGDVVIGHLHDARLTAVIVAAKEILFAMPRKERDGRGMVLPPTDIH